jgi:GTPase
LRDWLEEKLKFTREAIVEIGIEENGDQMELSDSEFDQIVDSLKECSQELNSNVTVIHRIGNVASVLIRKKPNSVQEIIELRISVAGNVDAGKVSIHLTFSQLY